MALAMKEGSQLSAAEAGRYLTEALIPLRLAVNGSDGCPLVASHWFRFQDGQLQCVVHKDSLIARRLAAAPCCGFEVAHEEPPYRGVRGQADVAISAEGAEVVLRALLERYAIREQSRLGQWLLRRASEERLLTLSPRWASGWDYRERMSDAQT